jgi:hypothetical protein
MKSQQRLASLRRWSSDRRIEGTFDHAVSTPREASALYDRERDDVRTALRPIIPFSRLSCAIFAIAACANKQIDVGKPMSRQKR